MERHEQPGGRARSFEQDGFRFDMGPSWYWMPDLFDRFFASFGHEVSDLYDLQRLDPSYRVVWPGGDAWDVPAGVEALRHFFEQRQPGAGEALDRFLAETQYIYEQANSDYLFRPSVSLLEYADPRLLVELVRAADAALDGGLRALLLRRRAPGPARGVAGALPRGLRQGDVGDVQPDVLRRHGAGHLVPGGRHASHHRGDGAGGRRARGDDAPRGARRAHPRRGGQSRWRHDGVRRASRRRGARGGGLPPRGAAPAGPRAPAVQRGLVGPAHDEPVELALLPGGRGRPRAAAPHTVLRRRPRHPHGRRLPAGALARGAAVLRLHAVGDRPHGGPRGVLQPVPVDPAGPRAGGRRRSAGSASTAR